MNPADTYGRAKAKLIEHGFDILYLEQDSRLMADHEEADKIIEVQLKTRIGVYKEYIGRGLHLCFPINKDGEEVWYLIPHDKLVEIVGQLTPWLDSSSWEDRGIYHSPNPSRRLIGGIAHYAFP